MSSLLTPPYFPSAGVKGRDGCRLPPGWDLDSKWLRSVRPARWGRWTLSAAEVAAGGGDEVERIADWQLSSITCPSSQMQVDGRGHVGWNGDPYTVYRGCLFASRSQVECCLSLIQPTIYQSVPLPGSSLHVTCSISPQCYWAVALLHWNFLSHRRKKLQAPNTYHFSQNKEHNHSLPPEKFHWLYKLSFS